eukprot:TRINITY_DN49639_c0_g1_i1.p1 TRINITY_DN49639_c0_g1~~TRINITY_DN49639_c0_g1_i1.p1  ORF type:complete len:165 (+),score=21.46 TRINITY_DN49639_c0_g1_i1:437-931(+)
MYSKYREQKESEVLEELSEMINKINVEILPKITEKEIKVGILLLTAELYKYYCEIRFSRSHLRASMLYLKQARILSEVLPQAPYMYFSSVLKNSILLAKVLQSPVLAIKMCSSTFQSGLNLIREESFEFFDKLAPILGELRNQLEKWTQENYLYDTENVDEFQL